MHFDMILIKPSSRLCWDNSADTCQVICADFWFSIFFFSPAAWLLPTLPSPVLWCHSLLFTMFSATGLGARFYAIFGSHVMSCAVRPAFYICAVWPSIGKFPFLFPLSSFMDLLHLITLYYTTYLNSIKKEIMYYHLVDGKCVLLKFQKSQDNFAKDREHRKQRRYNWYSSVA